MAKKPKPAPAFYNQAWRQLAPLLQPDLFENRDTVARNALAELQELERRFKEGQKYRST
jgi:hypothetical protein